MELIKTYFPELNETQLAQYEALYDLYTDWNAKINVISRKDIENLYPHHVLHSLGLTKMMKFKWISVREAGFRVFRWLSSFLKYNSIW